MQVATPSNIAEEIKVSYDKDTDAGGFKVRERFYRVIEKYKTKKKYSFACEHFCGHGGIGFYMYSKQLFEKMLLLDIYKPAIDLCKITIAENNLSNVHALVSESKIENLHGEIDLLIANPPWRSAPTDDLHRDFYTHQLRKKVDFDWISHKKFYDSITKATTEDVDIFVLENSRFSKVDDFAPMIKKAKLQIKGIYPLDSKTKTTEYILHLKKDSEK